MRAARYRFPLTLAIIGGDPRRFAPVRRALPPGARAARPAPLPVGVHSPGHMAETDAQAREELWPAYQVMRNRIGAERGWAPTSRAEFEREVAEGSLYVGSPETVARKIAATVRDLGVVPLRSQVQRRHAAARADAEEHRAVRPRSDSASAADLRGAGGTVERCLAPSGHADRDGSGRLMFDAASLLVTSSPLLCALRRRKTARRRPPPAW